MIKHSPTPWKTPLPNDAEIVDSEGYDICGMAGVYDVDYEQMEANAAHIVHCVNTHDQLVKALQQIADMRGWATWAGTPEEYVSNLANVAAFALAKAKATS